MVIRKISQQIRDIQRLGHIVKIFSRYGFGHILSHLPLDKAIISAITKSGGLPSSELSLPVRLRHACEELGPTFIKLAQVLSTRPDLVPIEISTEFEHLQDKVNPFPYEAARSLIIQELNAPPEDLFESFEQVPFAAASLSQVHRARLFTGEDVAVKVQRPDIRGNVNSDLEILSYLANLLERSLEDARPYNLPGIVKEFKKSIERELDFSIEAQSIKRFHKNFQNTASVHIPRVHEDFSSDKILTTEEIKGIKVSHIDTLKDKDYDLPTIARNGCQAVLRQVFEFGFFHADPHPGNIFVLPKNIVAFIDYGMVGRIDETSLYQFVDLLNSLVNRDIDGIMKAMLSIGVINEFDETRELRVDLEFYIDQIHDIPLKKINVGKLFGEFMEIQGRHRLKLPPVFTLLAKSLITIETVGRQLHPDLNFIEEATPFIEKLMRRRYNAEALYLEIKKVMLDIFDFARAFPKESRQIFARIREGRLKMEMVHKGLESPLTSLTQASNRVAMAIVLASMIIGSSLIVLSDIPPKIYEIPVIGLVGFLSSAFVGAWLLVSIFRHGRM